MIDKMLSTIWIVWQNLLFYDSKASDNASTVIDAGNNHRLRTRKSVQFSNVEVRVHEIILGDHPSTELYPISLGWAHLETEIFDVDHYLHIRAIRLEQKMREHTHKLRRTVLRLKAITRFDRLIDVGGLDEMELVEMEKARHKQNRDE
jgi:hypothetical protein